MEQEPFNNTHSQKIYKAIPAVMGEMDAVGKSKRSSGGGQNYNYRSIDQLLNSLQKLMAKHGIFIVPHIIERRDKEITTSNGHKMNHCLILFLYKFYADDGSYIESSMWGEAFDSGDKVSGKCASYAFKKVLEQVFFIPTEDSQDPDSTTYAPIINGSAPKQAIASPLKQDDGDMDEHQYWERAKSEPAKNQTNVFKITLKQRNRLFAIMNQRKEFDWNEQTLKSLIANGYGLESTKALDMNQYQEVCKLIETMTFQEAHDFKMKPQS